MFDISKLNDAGLEKEKDSLGEFVREYLQSGIYTFKIQNAFFTTSSGGATGLKLEAVVVDAKKKDFMPSKDFVYHETLWVTNKKGDFFFERDGKKIPLPGFTHAKNICLVGTGKPICDMRTTDKVIKEYDASVKSEIEKVVPVLTDLVGKTFKAAILHTRANKKVLNQATQEWVETNDEIFSNSLEKVFTMEDLTLNESVGGREPEFMLKWLDKHEGKINDKYKAGTSATKEEPTVTAEVSNAESWD